MRSIPRRRSDASHSFRIESGRSTRRASVMRSRSSHTRPHLVNTSGRSPPGSSRSRRPTTSSEWPRPYTAAVSIQLIPSSSARRIAASESASSCGPQPNAQPPPPIAQAPKPTVVMSSPLVPSGRVGKFIQRTPPQSIMESVGPSPWSCGLRAACAPRPPARAAARGRSGPSPRPARPSRAARRRARRARRAWRCSGAAWDA